MFWSGCGHRKNKSQTARRTKLCRSHHWVWPFRKITRRWDHRCKRDLSQVESKDRKIGSTTVPNKQLGSRKVIAAAYALIWKRLRWRWRMGLCSFGNRHGRRSIRMVQRWNQWWECGLGNHCGLRFQDNNKRIVVLDENTSVYSISLESKEIDSKKETGFGALKKSRFALGSDRYVAVLGAGKRAGVI